MRKEGWEKILVKYLEKSSRVSFEWGKRDCALWASIFVDLVTGSKHALEWRYRYSTEEGAKELIEQRGYGSVADIAIDKLDGIPVSMAKRGDLVLHPKSDSLGICDGRKSYFLLHKGITAVGTLQCSKAWRV